MGVTFLAHPVAFLKSIISRVANALKGCTLRVRPVAGVGWGSWQGERAPDPSDRMSGEEL